MKIAELLKEIDDDLWVLEEHSRGYFGATHSNVEHARSAREKLQVVTEVTARLIVVLEAARGQLQEQETPWALGEQVEKALEAAGVYDVEPENPWEEDPGYPPSEWQLDVRENNTRLGYQGWVAHKQEADRHDKAQGV